ncbi:MAG TPA: metalloregulator ArsR/SmtB family transcription factor [Pyrinomonadaceae bacterium]|nr:metalloregulator ArsR/SmtB family transcription factor [Pyrinomonadaceae bacterium]
MQTSNDKLSATFSALADPTRRAILGRLASGEASVSELAKPMKMTMPAVTKHLKVLQKAGLIRQERRAQWRPCYLVATPLKEASDWVFQYKKFWEESFDRLDEYLKALQAQNVSETVNPKGKRKNKDE